jgi:hypothetical protein
MAKAKRARRTSIRTLPADGGLDFLDKLDQMERLERAEQAADEEEPSAETSDDAENDPAAK